MIAQALAQANAPFINHLHETGDIDEHAACLREWGQRYDQLSAGTFDGTFEEFCFGNVQIFREQANQSIHESGMPWQGSLVVGVATSLDSNGWFCGENFTHDSIITLKGGEALDFRTPRRHELVAATIDINKLNDYALQVEHHDLGNELKNLGPIANSPEHAAKLRSFLVTVLASLRATPQMLAHEQIRKALEQSIYATILESIGSAPEPRQTPSSRALRIIVERARTLMHEHIDEPISVADLCIQLRVSRRTLQYSFQDVLGMNPVKFLRALRLNGVRRALKQADPQHDTVADIAAHWGFWHLSHFAADYREMFAELPSDTLRRARDPALLLPPPAR